MFDHLLESSHRDDSHKWSNIGFCKERRQVESIDVKFMHLIRRFDVQKGSKTSENRTIKYTYEILDRLLLNS